MKNKFLFLLVILLVEYCLPTELSSQHPSGTKVTDIDGNVYYTITIGKQVWMKENLKVLRYSNGDTIGTSIPDTLDLTNVSQPKFQWPPMRDEKNVGTYGRMYSWYTVTDERNICPKGWHVPTDEEFCILENYIEPGTDVNCNKNGHRGKNAGGFLKEEGLAHWTLPNNGSDNRSRFTGLPAGIRYANGDFTFLGSYAYFWTATGFDSAKAWSRRLYHNEQDVARWYYLKKDSFSVRCLKN
jgi:uncharacterized protein (TIGR02145 family)